MDPLYPFVKYGIVSIKATDFRMRPDYTNYIWKDVFRLFTVLVLILSINFNIHLEIISNQLKTCSKLNNNCRRFDSKCSIIG